LVPSQLVLGCCSVLLTDELIGQSAAFTSAAQKFESIPPQDYFSALTHLLFGGNQK
jgi:hypothetical protein